jgi:hypothetical protein
MLYAVSVEWGIPPRELAARGSGEVAGMMAFLQWRDLRQRRDRERGGKRDEAKRDLGQRVKTGAGRSFG